MEASYAFFRTRESCQSVHTKTALANTYDTQKLHQSDNECHQDKDA